VVLAGGGRHAHAADEETAVDATTRAVQSTLEAYLDAHFPWFQGASVQRRWSGTMGFSPDGLPVADRAPGTDRVLFATGFTGHGMGFGVWMGRFLAEWAITGTPPAAADLFRRR
jgi:glycine/D-amino acid oxidase-like deaminating enzyme